MFGGWGEYTTVGELKQRAKKVSKKIKNMTPVLPHQNTRKICVTWWGEAWCKNLESYADYDYRLERGRRYFRAETVVDFKIEGNVISAKVQGGERNPYDIDITFDKPDKKDVAAISRKLQMRIDNVDELLKGNFPDDLKELFTQSKPGLFPTPDEIHFNCDCLDWASMCKHIAAVMYAIGVKIDDDPGLLFELRGIDMDNFITGMIEDKVSQMLKNINKKSSRIIKDADLNAIFGL